MLQSIGTQTKRPRGWQAYGALWVSKHVTYFDTVVTHNNSSRNPPQHILYAQLRHESACNRSLLRLASFLISSSCSFPVTFLLLLTSCLSHFRHAIRSSQYFVRCFFSYFLRDPVGSISASQVCVEIYYANQPDNVTSLSPCLHSQVTTPGPRRVFNIFTREKSSYYHRELPIWHDMFLHLHLNSGSVATPHTHSVSNIVYMIQKSTLGVTYTWIIDLPVMHEYQTW
jgi:hypothetical protein